MLSHPPNAYARESANGTANAIIGLGSHVFCVAFGSDVDSQIKLGALGSSPDVDNPQVQIDVNASSSWDAVWDRLVEG